jgi:signal transduction histidine kinase/Fe-S-cluster-containing hydrogenase component 2
MDMIVKTAKDRCRRCYSCVRRCPAKAIRVQAGQAEVIKERCLGCGRCVKACTRRAREIVNNLPAVAPFLQAGEAVAMLAPSFPAAFEARPGQIVAGLRRVGFVGVYEVAFGADLVSQEYRKLREREPDRLLITTPCPAAVEYVIKFAPELVPLLAPVMSPMAAMGKALKARLRPGCRTVFAGPCSAKIAEAQDRAIRPWVDVVITFREINEMFEKRGIDPRCLEDEEFDPPHSYLGGIYPISGGLTRGAEISADLTDNKVADVCAPDGFTDLVARLQQHVHDGQLPQLETRLYDVLFCRGCISGPGFNGHNSLLASKDRVVGYMRSRRGLTTRENWERDLEKLADVDLTRWFAPDDQTRDEPSEEEIRRVLALTGKHSREDELNCRACGYRSCREKAIAVCHGLAEVEMCLPYLVERLESMVATLNQSHADLTEAQSQLLRSERLASMGQLAAGIAHEVNNPLGTILIYSQLVADALAQKENLDEDQLRSDVKMISAEAGRCKGIVSGLLDFARQSKVSRSLVDIAVLFDDAVRIVRAQTGADRYVFDTQVRADLPRAYIDRQQILQVLLNLLRNATEAMPDGGTIGARADWREASKEFVITVSDEGTGFAADTMNKLFSPFFSTKPVGRGTGLGLPICYGIVKMHRGAITARNNPDGRGATLEVTLPSVGPEEAQ